MNNPLLDSEFLKELDEFRSHEVYVRITALSVKELPLEYIEGKATGGSINIDGTSAVRRTCNLSMIAQDVNINEFYWGLHNKFKLEIGLKNNINLNYPDIIWFPQGIYVITSFSTSLSTSGFNISIAGKDKMCLLNGEVSGSLPASIDFGVEEYVDLDAQTTTYTKVSVKKIIREALHAYALEPYHNIIINDIEDSGLELLEYRGEEPLYLLYDTEREEYSQLYFDGNTDCYLIEEKDWGTLNDGRINYNKRIDTLVNDNPTQIKLKNEDGATIYTIARIEYGQTAGYRLTDLVYPGDLISNIGESITSVLDKIVNMLGNFEYFYDLDGRFIFQEKKTYVQTSWNTITTTEEDTYVDNVAYNSSNAYHFEGNSLISSFSNQPDLNNLKNDYSVWGVRKSVNDVEIPIHYRYAIHKKPKYYKNYNNIEFTDAEWDWREIIYQMALDYYQHNEEDDFYVQVGRNNYDYYPTGMTGYEQFYLDIQGFWRQLYNPQPPKEYYNYVYDTSDTENKTFIPVDDRNNVIEQKLLVKDKYTQLSSNSNITDRTNVYVVKTYNGNKEFQKLIDTLEVKYNFYVVEKQLYIKNNKFYHSSSCTESTRALYTTETIKDDDEKKNYYMSLNQIVYVIEKDDDDKDIKVYYKCTGGDKDGYATFVKDTEVKEVLESDKYFITADTESGYKAITYNIANRIEKKEIYIKDNDGNYISLLNSVSLNNNCYLKEESDDYISVDDLPGEVKKLYYENDVYNKYYTTSKLDIEGKPVEDADPILNYLTYYVQYYNYFTDVNDLQTLYWNKQVKESPDSLNFWMDFLDSSEIFIDKKGQAYTIGSELDNCAISAIGDRAKVINDTNVKSIYFRDVPNLIFTTYEQLSAIDLKEKTGYIFMFLPHQTTDPSGAVEFNYFNISAQGRSAKEKLDELLYYHSYCTESVNISSIPIYYLEPNVKISVRDDNSKINGEYLVSRLSIPLTYNGMMSITATKAPQRLY